MIATAALLALVPLLASAAPAPLSKRASNVLIQFDGDTSKCLTVQGDTVTDGSIVNVMPCAGAAQSRQSWDISLGANPSVKLTGTNFCLDAGVNPNDNFQQLKVWTCYPGLTQQGWYLTGDDHIAITGGSTCLDLADGNGIVQTYQCGGTNQRWVTGLNGTPTPSSSSSAAPPPSSAVSSSMMPSATPPSTTGRLIKAASYDNLCVTVQNGYAADGTRVALSGCVSAQGNALEAQFQRWDIVPGSTKVRLSGTNFCLDAGANPMNGDGAKIWTCYDGLPAQQWYLTGDEHLALENSFVCLDVVADSTPSYNKPYVSAKDLQSWQCSGPDANQLFVLA